MAFANWKSKKLQAAIVAISAIDEVITPVFSPTIATIATIADVESSKQATNDHYENVVVKMSEVLPTSTHYPKIAVEENSTIGLLKESVVVVLREGESYPQTEDKIQAWNMDRYTHLITCQQCEHFTLTGHCRVKPQYKPQPEAMRDCSSFEAVSGERVAITNAPYSASELNDLLSRYEKKLFHHLVDCVACSFMESRYCVDAFAIGSSYDAMLLVFDDAASKREALLNAVIRARISGRKVFVSLDHDKVPPPR